MSFPRPQPLGVFADPLGALLLPPVEGAEHLLPQVVRGNLNSLPQAWRFYELALYDEAAAFQALQSDPTPLGRYNRFVLRPSQDEYYALQPLLTGTEAALLEAVAFQIGLCHGPPDPHHLGPVHFDREVRAYLLATYAGYLLEQSQTERALVLLETAAADVEALSPAFAARLYGEWAAVEAQQGPNSDKGLAFLERAARLYGQTGFKAAQGELWLQLGMALQTRAQGKDKELLLRAVKAYQEATLVLRPEQTPESFGLAQMNLALVYLIIPMNEEAARLRYAIAASSLRESLKVFTPDTYPQHWASATVNLANVLQHANTTHPEENLWEAVALYEDVLRVRKPEDDPEGYARVLANQGNALAHLGAFSRAIPRLTTACDLFRQLGDLEAVTVLEEVLEDIAQRQPPEVEG